MTKQLDPDIKALRGATRALDESSSLKMLGANLRFLWDHYIGHPHKMTVEHFAAKSRAGGK